MLGRADLGNPRAEASSTMTEIQQILNTLRASVPLWDADSPTLTLETRPTVGKGDNVANRMKPLAAIKEFFTRKDSLTPDGGREVHTPELMELRKASLEGYNEVAQLCAAELGVELDVASQPAPQPTA